MSDPKKIMRSKFRDILSQMPIKTRAMKSREITSRLSQEKLFQGASAIFTYVALPHEVQTLGLIKQALRLGKKVFAPKIKGRNLNFEIREILDANKGLKKGRYGVLEPVSKKKIKAPKLDLIIVPGLAYDKKGNRLGRGGGYFDRFLENAKSIPKVGLAFKEQMVRKIPMEAHDVPVDHVIYA